MRLRRGALLGLAGLVLAIAPISGAGQSSGELHFGSRTVGASSSQFVAEVRIAPQVKDWRLRPEVGLAGSANIGGSQWNILAGVRLDPAPAVSLGAGIDVISDDSTDRVLGGYVTGSLRWLVNGSDGIGVDARASFASTAQRRIDCLPEDVGYRQWTFFARFGI